MLITEGFRKRNPEMETLHDPLLFDLAKAQPYPHPNPYLVTLAA